MVSSSPESKTSRLDPPGSWKMSATRHCWPPIRMTSPRCTLAEVISTGKRGVPLGAPSLTVPSPSVLLECRSCGTCSRRLRRSLVRQPVRWPGTTPRMRGAYRSGRRPTGRSRAPVREVVGGSASVVTCRGVPGATKGSAAHGRRAVPCACLTGQDVRTDERRLLAYENARVFAVATQEQHRSMGYVKGRHLRPHRR